MLQFGELDKEYKDLSLLYFPTAWNFLNEKKRVCDRDLWSITANCNMSPCLDFFLSSQRNLEQLGKFELDRMLVDIR